MFEIKKENIGNSGKAFYDTSSFVWRSLILSPLLNTYSVKFCDVDENGVQHMVLCRIIMGSMEKVQLGSEQFHPSSEDFDSGVDNIQNLYVIWNAHVNTRILPEYVVSFKLLPSQQGIQEFIKPL